MSRKRNKRQAANSVDPPVPLKSPFPLRRLFVVVLIAELIWVGWHVGCQLARTAPPALRINAELLNIQDTFRDRVESLQQQLDAAVRSDQTPQAWLDLGSLYFTTGHYPQAELCIRYAQTLDAHAPDIAFALGATLDLLGRMREAIEQYELASQFATGRQLQASHFQIGKNYLRLEQPENAIDAFREIYTFLPASYELVKIYTRQGKLDQAINEMRILIHNRPHALETHALAAKLAAAQGKHQMAAQQRSLADTAVREVPFAPLQEFSEDFRARFPSERDSPAE